MSKEMTYSPYGEKAKALFLEGYNCAQSVALAFADQCDMDEKTMLRLSSSFGGGIGRLREVCGAVSGMCMVAGILYGYEDPEAQEEKKEHYALIQKMAKEFESYTGSLICRELLNLSEKREDPTPEQRTEQYYFKRPCADLVAIAATIMEQQLKQS